MYAVCCGGAFNIFPSEILGASEISGGSFPRAPAILPPLKQNKDPECQISANTRERCDAVYIDRLQWWFPSVSRKYPKANYNTWRKCSAPSALSCPECKGEHSVSSPSVSEKHSENYQTLGNFADCSSAKNKLRKNKGNTLCNLIVTRLWH